MKSQDIAHHLATLFDPYTGLPYAQAGRISGVQFEGGRLSFAVAMPYPCASLHPIIKAKMDATLLHVPGVEVCDAQLHTAVPALAAAPDGSLAVPGVKNIIAVASGKGGVGKSTTAVNLALALQYEGAKVGILDADIYGPSMPHMLGVSGRPELDEAKRMIASVAFGLQMNSIGLLVDGDKASAWRGPMASNALDTLLKQTAWQDLDYLIVDMPPGTGDIQLTMAQRAPVTGAVIVTTPQNVALLDAVKGVQLFQTVQTPILGVLENMAVYTCTACGHQEHIFGQDGGQKLAADAGCEVLGHMPLKPLIREQADSGVPLMQQAPDSDEGRLYREIARKVGAKMVLVGKPYTPPAPPAPPQPKTVHRSK